MYMCSMLSTMYMCICTDATIEDRADLLLKKLEQCSYVFDFTDPMSDLRSKEIKRAALAEILDHVTSGSVPRTEPIYQALIRLVGLQRVINICKTLRARVV